MGDNKVYFRLMTQLQRHVEANDYYRFFELTDDTNNSFAYITSITLQDISKKYSTPLSSPTQLHPGTHNTTLHYNTITGEEN